MPLAICQAFEFNVIYDRRTQLWSSMAKKSKKKRSHLKNTSSTKCSTPILENHSTPDSLGLSSIATNSSTTQENLRHQNRIAKKRVKKRDVQKTSRKIVSEDSDSDWETELEASVQENTDPKYLSWSPASTVGSSKLFYESPERVRDARHFHGATLDEPISASFQRIIRVEKDPTDELLHIDFPLSGQAHPSNDQEANASIDTNDDELCFDSARVVKTYPGPVKNTTPLPILDQRWFDMIPDMPIKTPYAEMLWREFIKNPHVAVLLGNSKNDSNYLSTAQSSNDTSSGDEMTWMEDPVKNDGMVTASKRWDKKARKCIQINPHNAVFQMCDPKEKDKERITKIRSTYVKRTLLYDKNDDKGPEASQDSTRYKVFEFPGDGEGRKQNVIIPPTSKKPRITSVQIINWAPKIKNVRKFWDRKKRSN